MQSPFFLKRKRNGFTYPVEYPDYILISTHSLPCHHFLIKDQDQVLPIPIEKASNLHWNGNNNKSNRQQVIQLVRTFSNLVGLDSSPSQLSSLRVLVCPPPTLLIGMMTSKRKQHSHISRSTLNRARPTKEIGIENGTRLNVSICISFLSTKVCSFPL